MTLFPVLVLAERVNDACYHKYYTSATTGAYLIAEASDPHWQTAYTFLRCNR